MHRFNVLRRSQGEVCKALNHEQVHAWRPAHDQAFSADRPQRYDLSFSARETFRAFDLRADSSGRWPLPPLINAEQARFIQAMR